MITPKRHRSTKRLLSVVSQRREEREKCEGGKGKQNGKGGEDEKSPAEQMDTGQACAPVTGWLFITQVHLIATPGQKVTQHPSSTWLDQNIF